jgi:hypothetical protein
MRTLWYSEQIKVAVVDCEECYRLAGTPGSVHQSAKLWTSLVDDAGIISPVSA